MEAKTWHRGSKSAILGALLCALAASTAAAEPPAEQVLFRIGTGGAGGTYFPVANLLATALSGLTGCQTNQDCGMPGLLAVAQISNGSVANIRDLRNGSLEAGLAQADVASAAYSGSEPFVRDGPYRGLRAVANLYPESVHLVVRAGSDIRSVADLRGRKVSLEEPGSGTLLEARRILQAYGLTERDMRAVYIKPQLAARAVMEDRLDAFFAIAGYPATAIADLAAVHSIRLIPIAGAEALAVLRAQPYFAAAQIPAGVYQGVMATPTLAVGAQLLVDARLDEDLVYRITGILWSESTLKTLAGGHPKGAEIRPERALEGLSVPLHPGAARYYREMGMLRTPSDPP